MNSANRGRLAISINYETLPTQMSKELFIGLMSGTSVDGVDSSIVSFEDNKIEIVSSYYEECPKEIRENILTLCEGSKTSLKFLGETDIAVGELFASVVNTHLKKSKIDSSSITAIGSHGQTVWHQPFGTHSFTMQLGSPSVISQKTGITTVSGFRQKDVANGGQGAPLTPVFHQEFFSKKDRDRAIINIGGMTNITLLPKTGTCSAYDIGAGNVLMDYWNLREKGTKYDKNGDWAATGQCSKKLLQEMLAEPYLKLSPPKSTGRELFNEAWLQEKISLCGGELRAEDIQNTLSNFTSECISDAVKSFSKDLEIYVCGGGAHNSFLMKNLKANFDTIPVETTSKLGIEPDWVEAVAFAWMAKQTVQGKKLETKPFTGATKSCVLGGIYQGN